ncbi:MAG: hypothetical protein QMC97_04220 [Pseudothermotoga sp.]|uniref:hypothetical protein n=1 Tax=Pseudothermotoga sp. TaxID=2033661 RepID=UPI0025836C8B|nr:hypothetical protein [Pseudothermotoga sp.]MDI6862570.1 hypothetical protein [Pseudothermotoga sp.]
MIASLMGAVLLAGKTFTLLIFTLLESVNLHGMHPTSAVFVLTLFLVVLEGWREFEALLKNLPRVRWELKDLLILLDVIAGALFTFTLSVTFGLGPIVAAGLVGVIAAAFFRRHEVPIYCGAFVGMVSADLLPSHWHVLLASSIAGFVFLISKFALNGFGGKLGTIALVGCTAAALLTDRTFIVGSVPGWDVGVHLLLHSVLGVLFTYVLNVRFSRSPVMSSGIVGLAGGLLLPILHPEFGSMLASMVICASFAGMSKKERMPNQLYAVLSGLLCGLVFMYSVPHFGGAGGKLGTIAFASVIATAGFRRLLSLAGSRSR